MNTLLAPPVMVYRQIRRLSRRFVDQSQATESDDFVLPTPVNWALYKFFAAESSWLTYHSLPFGTSVICIARKYPNGYALES